jgi:fatty acid desaturase
MESYPPSYGYVYSGARSGNRPAAAADVANPPHGNDALVRRASRNEENVSACLRHHVDKEEKPYIPASEFHKTFWESRIYLLIFAAVIATCFYTSSILSAMFVVLPSFYGSILVLLFGIIQHLDLHEDVLDHRLNTRTVYMNPVFRFLYWNMNYHIEHHMFPMVPYHALPALHKEMKADCPVRRQVHGKR